MSRAISIRGQLKKYMQRFGLPLESCEGDAKRLRECLVSGYWRNGARGVADGTYRSVRGNVVCVAYFTTANQALSNFTDSARSSELCTVYSQTSIWVGHIPRNGGNQENTVSSKCSSPTNTAIIRCIESVS